MRNGLYFIVIALFVLSLCVMQADRCKYFNNGLFLIVFFIPYAKLVPFIAVLFMYFCISNFPSVFKASSLFQLVLVQLSVVVVVVVVIFWTSRKDVRVSSRTVRCVVTVLSFTAYQPNSFRRFFTFFFFVSLQQFFDNLNQLVC